MTHPLMMTLLLNALTLTQVVATNSTMMMDGGGHHPDRHLGQEEVDMRPFADFTIDHENNMVILDQHSYDYQIEGLISENSFGRVYNAKEKLVYISRLQAPDEKATIKVINNVPVDSEPYKRAKKEIHYLEDLEDSENFVTFLGSHEKGSTMIIVFEEYCSSNLFDWMAKHPRGLEVKQVNSKFVPFLSKAVQQMRSKNIHSDLNPANILLCANVWKVAGFDRAESTDNEYGADISSRGTPGYTDPQVIDDGNVHFDSDLYSVGAILYTLVTGTKHVRGTEFSLLDKTDADLAYFIRQLLSKKFSLEEFYDYADYLYFFGAFRVSASKIPKTVRIGGFHYRIGPFISKGSFGSVFKATPVKSDGTDGKKVAIKLITAYGPRKKKDRIFKEAEKEIRFLNQLKDSSNVVTILNSEVKSSSVAIVMELCTSSLADLIIEEDVFGKDLDPDRVVSEFVPFLSSAVHQLRSKDIVHFDLKPGNILRCGNVWKVADFDTAELVPDGGILQVSQRGTRGFTEPEMLRKGGGVATSKTDLYSVGAILYTLLTRRIYYRNHVVEDLSRREYEPLGNFIQKLLGKKFKTLDKFYIRSEELINPKTRRWKLFGKKTKKP